MMARKTETPFDKIVVTHTRLRLFIQYGDHAIDGQTPQEFAGDVLECFEHLLTFRNMVNGMAALAEHPEDAALIYISHDRIKAAGDTTT